MVHDVPVVVAAPSPRARFLLNAPSPTALPLPRLVWSARVALGACVGRGKRSPSNNIRPQGCRPPSPESTAYSSAYCIWYTRSDQWRSRFFSSVFGPVGFFVMKKTFCQAAATVACFDLRRSEPSPLLFFCPFFSRVFVCGLRHLWLPRCCTLKGEEDGAGGAAAPASQNNLIINYLPSHVTEIELRVSRKKYVDKKYSR